MIEIHKRSGSKQEAEVLRSSMEKALLGCIVTTMNRNKTFRIDDIAWDMSPTTEFTMKNGESVSLVKYYADKYGITIRDTKQPLIVSYQRKRRAGIWRPISLIPELCYMTGRSVVENI